MSKPIIIKSNSKRPLVIAVLCFLGLGAGILRYSAQNVEWTKWDGAGMILLGGLGLMFLLRYLAPKTVIKVTPKSLWTNQTGQVEWDEIHKVKIEIPGNKGSQKKTFLLKLKPRESGFEEYRFELDTLKIHETEFIEEVLPLIDEHVLG
ncbi:MAG: hypothetical protein MRY83_01115 [Flavobacteriales bacterium]|nr:hypothetical protein [Flavobacteriales bacterium]